MIINLIVHFCLLILMPPLLLGIINKVKALFAGRRGPPLLQAYFDIGKLLRKGMVISRSTTWVFIAGPVVTLAAVFCAGTLIPLGRFAAPISFTGDLVLFAYLFGLARFFTTSAALDTGSAFEGMGAAREVTFAVLSEPALFLAFFVFIRLSGSLSLGEMLHLAPAGYVSGAVAPLVLVAIGLFIIMLAETCRIPVDDPNTHLELTMIHEVMVLDHSGPLLGIVLYAAAMKLFVLSSLLLHVLQPFKSGLDWLDWLIFSGGMMVIAGTIGVVESVMARLRMNHVPHLLVAAIILCGAAFVLLVR